MIKSKISLLTGLTCRLRGCLNVNCLQQLYFTLVYPHLLQCCATKPSSTLFITQKKLLRVRSFRRRCDHRQDIFIYLRLLKLQDIIYLQNNLFVRRSLHSLSIDSGVKAMPAVLPGGPVTYQHHCAGHHMPSRVSYQQELKSGMTTRHLKTDKNVRLFNSELIRRLSSTSENL